MDKARRSGRIRMAWAAGLLALALALPAAAAVNPTVNILGGVSAGNVVPGAGSGTVTVSSAGNTRTASPTTLLISSSPGTITRGSFTATGTAGDSFTAAGAGSIVTLSGPGTGVTVNPATVTLKYSTTKPKFPTGTGTTTSPTEYCGLTLTIAAGAAAGTYSGTVTLQVTDTTASPQRLGTGSLPVTVTLLQPISITRTADLAFGTFSPTSSAGSVVMSAAGARTTPGGVKLEPLDPGHPASFTVTGGSGLAYSVAVSPTSVGLSNGVQSMTAKSFTTSPSGTGGLLGGGSQVLTLGGTLTVSNNQATGTYTSTTPITVTVTYN